MGRQASGPHACIGNQPLRIAVQRLYGTTSILPPVKHAQDVMKYMHAFVFLVFPWFDTFM